LAWWRYPYSHLRTELEFQALADEYEQNLSELELDLSHANVDNARLEAEYIRSNDISFVFYQKNPFFPFRLEQTRAELIDERVKSTDEKIYTDAELSNLRLR